MKELILCFLPLSLTQTLSVTSAFQPSLWLTLEWTDVTLSIFYLVSECEEQSAAPKRKHCLHEIPLSLSVRARKHSHWDWLHLLWPFKRSSSCRVYPSCAHMTHMSHTCSQFDDTHWAERLVCSDRMTTQRPQRLAGEHAELLACRTKCLSFITDSPTLIHVNNNLCVLLIGVLWYSKRPEDLPSGLGIWNLFQHGACFKFLIFLDWIRTGLVPHLGSNQQHQSFRI